MGDYAFLFDTLVDDLWINHDWNNNGFLDFGEFKKFIPDLNKKLIIFNLR